MTVMIWAVVSFDRRGDPGRNYDMIFLNKMLKIYNDAGKPKGFALYDGLLAGEHLHAYSKTLSLNLNLVTSR